MHAFERGTSPSGWTHPLALCGSVGNGESARTAPSHSSSVARAPKLDLPVLRRGQGVGQGDHRRPACPSGAGSASEWAAADASVAGATASTITVGPVGTAAGAEVDAGWNDDHGRGRLGRRGGCGLGRCGAGAGRRGAVRRAACGRLARAGRRRLVVGRRARAIGCLLRRGVGRRSRVRRRGGSCNPRDPRPASRPSAWCPSASCRPGCSPSAPPWAWPRRCRRSACSRRCFLGRSFFGRPGRGRRLRRRGSRVGLEGHGCLGLELDRLAAGLFATGLGCRGGRGSSGGRVVAATSSPRRRRQARLGRSRPPMRAGRGRELQRGLPSATGAKRPTAACTPDPPKSPP